MLVFTVHAGIYDALMLVFTIHAGIYTSCWYLRFMLVFTIMIDSIDYDSIDRLRFMLVFTIMVVFTLRTGIYGTSMKCKYQHES